MPGDLPRCGRIIVVAIDGPVRAEPPERPKRTGQQHAVQTLISRDRRGVTGGGGGAVDGGWGGCRGQLVEHPGSLGNVGVL